MNHVDVITAIMLVLAVGLAGIRLKVLDNRKSSDKKLINEPFTGDFLQYRSIRDNTRRIDPNNGVF